MRSLQTGAVRSERIIEGKKMLLRIVSMLCGLVDRLISDDIAGRFCHVQVERAES